MCKPAMRIVVALFLALTAPVEFVAADSAAPPVYYVSMRSLASEPMASFVLVVRPATSERSSTITGCDGRLYYATAADAEAIAAARAGGEAVHLHRGAQGQQPQDMPIKCKFD